MKKGYSEESVSIIKNSISKNTLKQYETCIKQWWAYCNIKRIEPLQLSVPNIVSFLTDKFNKGSKYGTLNSIRSSLSLILDYDLGSHRDIKRFFKGVYRLRPNKPKYDVTWDPSQVLNHVQNLYPNLTLKIEVLSKKLIILLVLVTAQRIQTMSLIKINNIHVSDSDIKIKIPDIIKTSKINKNQPLLTIPFFKENLSICPATTLLDYLDVTKLLRKDHLNLFITCRKPYGAASTHTISRWIKNMLSDSGIDTSIFTPHSTRHASTSHANRCGVNVDVIRKTAGWSERSNTFANFYNRPLVAQNNFGNNLMNSL